MKREQLRESFERVRPREALIQSTLEKIHAQQARGPVEQTEGKWTLGFVTRLASAACALLLVIGVGIVFAKNGMLPTDEVVPVDERTTPMTIDSNRNGDDMAEPEDGVLVGCEEMIAAARAYGTDWAVFSATVDAVYFKSETVGIATLCPITIADRSLKGESAVWTDEKNNSLTVCFDANDAEMHALLANMGDVLVGLHTEERDGETVWVIHEAYAEDVPVE